MNKDDWKPLPVPLKNKEADIESRAKARARAEGWYVRKFTSPSNRSVPDDIFIKDGQVVFIEFKRPGKKPTKPQREEHRKLLEVGYHVEVIDNSDEALALLRGREGPSPEYLEAQGIHAYPNTLCPVCWRSAVCLGLCDNLAKKNFGHVLARILRD